MWFNFHCSLSSKNILQVDLKKSVLRSSLLRMKIVTILLALSLARAAIAQEENVFGYRDVVQKAETLSKQPFIIQNQELSPDLQHLDYDLYRRIRFLPERSVWRDSPYRLGFFHPGYYFKRRVLFEEIEKDRLRDI